MKINPEVSTGNLLSMATIIVACGIAWGATQSEISAMKLQAVEIKALISEKESRIRVLETGAAGITAEVRGLRTDIIDLKEELRATREALNGKKE